MCNEFGGDIPGAKGVPDEILHEASISGVSKINVDTEKWFQDNKNFEYKFLHTSETQLEFLQEYTINEIVNNFESIKEQLYDIVVKPTEELVNFCKKNNLEHHLGPNEAICKMREKLYVLFNFWDIDNIELIICEGKDPYVNGYFSREKFSFDELKNLDLEQYVNDIMSQEVKEVGAKINRKHLIRKA